ncbi:MAG: diadenylate cyclase CdaA [Bacteroidales bacterium]|jgi:uncharacterized protein (TIGR00159 family)|nr:diadenylate cyclase CdaA [Bacteroidales bacterium]
MILASIQTFQGIKGIIDIILVVCLFFLILKLIRGTPAQSIFIGFIAIYVFYRIVDVLEMQLLSEILGGFISVGSIAMIIIFQPEIRKFLNLAGTKILKKRRYKWLFHRGDASKNETLATSALVQACGHMANAYCGALIVVCRGDKLENVTATGDKFEAQINIQLIETIFFKNSPLHDGALIIGNNLIKAARCILPVSQSNEIAVSLGLRHRSAVGITELTDAIAIVVSEQTGHISIAENGKLETNVTLIRLQEYLDQIFNPQLTKSNN